MSSTTSPAHAPCATEWPALSPPKLSSHDHLSTDNDWELLPEPTIGSDDSSFEKDTIDVIIPLRKDINETTEDKPKCLKHAQSTPDFRHYNAEGVLIGSYDEDEDGLGSLASSSIVMVSGPSSVISSQSCWSESSKLSFRDAIMKEHRDPKDNVIAEKGSPQETKQPRVTRKKPKFVVKPIKRCSKSTGDLQSLTRIVESDEHHGDDDLILGDTDAQLYYNQKAQGKLGRKNGRKIRPDEAKRKQISMAKKDDQRQRQQAAKKC